MDNQTGFFDIFSKSGLFADIEKDELAGILGHGRRCTYQTGDTLFLEGDPAETSFLVLKGLLKLSKLHKEGKETIVRYIHPAEITAIISVFKGNTYPATAECVEPSEVAGFDRKTMLEIISDYPQVAINLLGAVTQRLENIQDRYMELQAERVEQRIARSLLRIMNQSGRKTEEGILIGFRLSRKDLADYTGTTLYTVSRTLSSWEQRGWIVSRRERIVVSDPHALATFAETG